jgi:hypothetical protein
MLPVILVAVGAYLIGDSVLEDKKSYDDGGMMAKGGQLEVGDMVMVDDSGYAKYFSGFDVSKPAKIISKNKGKSFGKVKYFYGLETSDGKKPFNQAIESMLTKVSKDGGMMAHGGKTQGYDDREDERLGMKDGKMSMKDLDSTHARRDDARFEERGKMAKGGQIDFDKVKTKYATQDINLLQKEGRMAITDTKKGVLFGEHKGGVFSFTTKDGKNIFSGNKQ